MLGSELWESKFDGLLSLVKEYTIDVWEIQKHYSDSGSSLQFHSQSSPGERTVKLCQNGEVHLGIYKCKHLCTKLWGVVNDGNTIAAIY